MSQHNFQFPTSNNIKCFDKLLLTSSECDKKCDCNQERSDSVNDCDKENGQCKCKQNVSGRKCDKCAAGFWNWASGKKTNILLSSYYTISK